MSPKFHRFVCEVGCWCWCWHGLLTKEGRVKLDKGIKAIEYLKNVRLMQMLPNITDTVDYGSKASGNSDLLSGSMARTTNQATGLLAKATEKTALKKCPILSSPTEFAYNLGHRKQPLL